VAPALPWKYLIEHCGALRPEGTMANPKHLARLNDGVEVWNQWREKALRWGNDEAPLDLSEASLSKANLSGRNLEKANLCGANQQCEPQRKSLLIVIVSPSFGHLSRCCNNGLFDQSPGECDNLDGLGQDRRLSGARPRSRVPCHSDTNVT
jgi:hypothetical protein